MWKVDMRNQTIQEAVGEAISRLRQKHGLTLDQIAQAARDFGAGWGGSSVGNMERGQASMTLQNLILLALAINKLTNENLALADLLGPAETLTFAADRETTIPRHWFDRILGSAPVRMDSETSENLSPDDSDGDTVSGGEVVPGWIDEAVSEDVRRGIDRQRQAQGFEPMSDIEWTRKREQVIAAMASVYGGSLAEKRAAAKLGVSVERVQVTARLLWDSNSLDNESARRAGPGSSPQKRGRVTRNLVEELRDALGEEK